MKPFRLHPEAEDEVTETATYYESRREGLGGEFRATLWARIQEICRIPAASPLYKGSKLRRTWVEKYPFRILYFDRESEVYIVAVVHDKRREDYWADRLDSLDPEIDIP